MAHSLVVVGSVALDSIEHRDIKKPELLGGSASFFSLAASYFAPVKLVAVIGTDFPAKHEQLLARHGVDLAGLEKAEGRTFRWTGRYSDDLAHRTTLDTQLNVFADFRPQLPAGWEKTDLLFLGNIHPALQLDVLQKCERPKLVAMDTMNFWISGELAALKKTLARVNLLVINDEEVRQLAEEHNLVRAARAVRAMGPKTVIVKRGDAGALLFHEDGIFAAPAYPLEEVVDPTGAGDSFAGGFMGSLARSGDLSPLAIRRAMYYGSVMASFSVEAWTVDRLIDLPKEQIESRYRAFCDLTHFESVKIA